MIFFLGSMQLVPAIALMFFAVAGALVLAGWSALFTPATGSHAVTLSALSVAVALSVSLELASRWRARRALDAVSGPASGGKARGLATLQRLGLACPAWTTLDTEACRAVMAGAGLSRRAARFLRAQRGHRVIVRSSFAGEDGAHTWAGIFESVRDVDPGDPAAVIQAIRTVVASAQGAPAAAYARHHGLDAPAPAVVLQRQVEAKVLGVALSRGVDGREDHVTIDATRSDGATETLVYDLLTDALTDAPAATWHGELAELAIRLERALGAPTQLEFAVDSRDALWCLQARPISLPQRRRTWVNGGPLEMRPLGSSPEIRAQRGGLERLAAVLSASNPTGARIVPGDLREVSGVPYLAASALRRLRAESGAVSPAVLFRALLGRVPRGDAFDAMVTAQATMTGWIAVLDGLVARLRCPDDDEAPRPAWGLTTWVSSRSTRRRRVLVAARDALHEQLVELEASAGLAEDVMAFAARVHDPPLPVDAAPRRDGTLVGRALVGGVARGEARSQAPAEAARPYVLVAPDGDPARTPDLTGACGLVLLSGGALSHLATTALELDLPTVLCPGAQPPWRDGDRIEVDGDVGTARLTTA